MGIVGIRAPKQRRHIVRKAIVADHEDIHILYDHERLQNTHHGAVYEQLYKFHILPQDMEDIAQEIWLRVYKNRHVYDPARGLKLVTWITTIARNIILNHLKNKQKLSRNPHTNDRFTKILSISGSAMEKGTAFIDAEDSGAKHDPVFDSEIDYGPGVISHGSLSVDVESLITSKELETLLRNKLSAFENKVLDCLLTPPKGLCELAIKESEAKQKLRDKGKLVRGFDQVRIRNALIATHLGTRHGKVTYSRKVIETQLKHLLRQ